MSSPLFKGSRDDFKIVYCANCGTYLSIRQIIKIDGKEYKVCSGKCETELREKIKQQA